MEPLEQAEGDILDLGMLRLASQLFILDALIPKSRDGRDVIIRRGDVLEVGIEGDGYLLCYSCQAQASLWHERPVGT